MKLAVDARPLVDPAQGGVARVARALVQAYADTFPDDTLVCVTTGSTRPTLPDGLSNRPNVEHVHYPIPNKLWSALSVFGLSSLTDGPTFLPNLGFVGSIRGPYTLLLHDLSFLIEPRWFTPKQRLWHRAVRATELIRRADHLLAVSETTKQDAMRLLGIPADRITVIPIGPTLSYSSLRAKSDGARQSLAGREIASSQTSRNDVQPYVLALGWDDPRKNARTAELAVDMLRRDSAFADLKLLIVGRDVMRPTDAELAELYRGAAAFLYPSWYEGYGLPLHEAAQFGTPCIASTAGALPETAPHGTLFADPAKPHHWAEALRTTLAQREHTTYRTDTTHWTDAAKILKKSTGDSASSFCGPDGRHRDPVKTDEPRQDP